MSVYLDMWELVKELTHEEAREWVEKYGPAQGKDVEFRGRTFFDVDLREALANWGEG